MKELYNTLPIGEENAISLSDLAEKWETTGRDARRKIEQMIYHDMIVCNLRNGYFRPANIDEIKAYTNIVHSYLLKFYKKVYRLNKAIENFNQLKIPNTH